VSFCRKPCALTKAKVQTLLLFCSSLLCACKLLFARKCDLDLDLIVNMSLNAFLHPRNPYRRRPDFGQLAKQDARFKAVVKTDLRGKINIDFKDREAVRILTVCLLKEDFGLNVDIPRATLVPTLPLRLNYLLWLEDIMRTNKVASTSVVGLDVGVGAACVYPLLAVKYLSWKMLGTEVSEANLTAAKANVDRNGLGDRIQLAAAGQGHFDCLNGTKVAFTMCNPPFYGEEGEDVDSGHGEDDEETGKKRPERQPLHDTPAGAKHEMRTHGGEVEFVSRMIEESAANKDDVGVFTCMLGHKSSVKAIKHKLDEYREQGVAAVATTEFCQGRTMRWGVAWTYKPDITLPETSLFKKKKDEKKLHEPVISTLTFAKTLDDGKALLRQLTEWLEIIDVEVKPGKEDRALCSFTMKTRHQNWKGQRRKRREKQREEAKLEAGPESKRARTEPKEEEEEDMETGEEVLKVQLCARVTAVLLASKREAKLDVTLNYGEAGKQGIHGVLQYLTNKAKGM